ncbi:MAG TPA: hypothetical protein VKG05_08395 [Steroidobacteraceae bacterium]|nr:hypothetical protein [Steroidobacteraceae bacterium]
MRQGIRAIGLLGLVALLNPLVSTASSASVAKHMPSAVSLFRWAAAGAAASALASVIVVYLYPIEADTLLLLSLVILALTGLLCAVVATAFERDEVLSNVICNRPKKTQVSTAFFLFVAAPVLVLAAAIAVVAIPGVVDWAGGVIAMVRALGVHP